MEADVKAALRDLVSANPMGVSTERLCKTLRHTPQELGDTFEELIGSAKILGFAGIWLTPPNYVALSQKIAETLRELHAESPKTHGYELAKIAKLLGVTWGPKPLDRLSARMAEDGKIELHEGLVSLPDFQLELTPRQVALLDRVVEILEGERVNTPTPQTLAQTLGMPRQAVEEILRLGIKSGSILHLGENVYYTSGQLTRLVDEIRIWAAGREFSPNEVRDWLGSTRKYVHPIMEHLDAKGYTEKNGPLRKIVSE